MKHLRHVAAAVAALAGLAQAEPGRPPGPPPVARILASIGVDEGRAQQVVAIFDTSRQKAHAARQQIGRPTDDATRATLHAAMEAIRTDTDQKLSQVLDADELAKLRAAMPPPRPHRGPPPSAPAS